MKQLLFTAFTRKFVRFGACLTLLTLAFLSEAYGGFLYVYNDTSNSIYGYSVNERSGALTPLAGFPVIVGGEGGTILYRTELMNIDPVNNRLYVISDGSDTVNAYSISTTTGALTALPFSPIQLPAGVYNSVKLNPTGSLLAANSTQNSTTHIYAITPTTASLSQSLTFNIDGQIASTTVFSRDGNYFYQIAGGGTAFRGFNVNPTTGFMTELTGSPFSPTPGIGPLTDSQGRIFGIFSNSTSSAGRVFTTNQGIPTLVHQSSLGNAGFEASALHPNERFFAAVVNDRVFSVRINGMGAGTTLQSIADSTSGGSSTGALVFNQAGNFVFAINFGNNTVSTFNFFRDTGGITLNNVQPLFTNGNGNAPGIAYLPTGIPVFVSGRVTDANGRAISGAVVTATSPQDGIVHTVRTNPFGYYVFDDLIMGTNYTFEVRQKQFTFAPQAFMPNQETNELNFTASP